MNIVHWLIGGFQRMQSAYSGFVYRVVGEADTTGPTIMSGLIGR